LYCLVSAKKVFKCPEYPLFLSRLFLARVFIVVDS
jgi:hypothetical protein